MHTCFHKGHLINQCICIIRPAPKHCFFFPFINPSSIRSHSLAITQFLKEKGGAKKTEMSVLWPMGSLSPFSSVKKKIKMPNFYLKCVKEWWCKGLFGTFFNYRQPKRSKSRSENGPVSSAHAGNLIHI